MSRHEMRDRIEDAAAAAAREVPGVACLQPGLAELLRGTKAPRIRPVGGCSRSSGVRASTGQGPDDWVIEVKVSTLTGHRAVEVTRAVRAAVEQAVRHLLPVGGPPGTGTDTGTDTGTVSVTVTVTAVV